MEKTRTTGGMGTARILLRQGYGGHGGVRALPARPTCRPTSTVQPRSRTRKSLAFPPAHVLSAKVSRLRLRTASSGYHGGPRLNGRDYDDAPTGGSASPCSSLGEQRGGNCSMIRSMSWANAAALVCATSKTI